MVKYERFCVYEVISQNEQNKFAIIVSPEEIHDYQNTVLVVPLLPIQTNLPFRVPIVFKNKQGELAIEQIQPVFKKNLLKKVGLLPTPLAEKVAETLMEMFML